MKCFVTGATGFIGNKLVEELLKRGNEVNVLVRSVRAIKLESDNLTVFQGDLFDLDSIEKAILNCDVVYHLAAYANIWSKDKMLAFNTNVTGTKNILEAAMQNKVKKVVFTSSAATLSHSKYKEEVDETFPVPDKYLTEYETTKNQAEQLCVQYVKKGLDVVIVNPTRVFGPGLLNKSNSVTILIQKYLNGTWRIIPGDGSQIGNYVFIDDVIQGHILAMQKGIPGEKYILGGTNISYNDFFELLKKESEAEHTLFHLPFPIMMAVSKFELFMANSFGKKPLITPPWVTRYMQNRLVSNKKAKEQLTYSDTPLDDGIKKTIKWLKSN